MYILSNFSKLPIVFAKIANCICPNYHLYLSKLPIVFVLIANCICPTWQINWLHLKDQSLPTTISTAFKLVLAGFNFTAGNTMRDPDGEEYRL